MASEKERIDRLLKINAEKREHLINVVRARHEHPTFFRPLPERKS